MVSMDRAQGLISKGRKLRPSSAVKVRVRKHVDPWYLSTEHRQWRDLVIKRAAGRCQAITDGQRCTRAAPRHRMFADHVTEVRDGGALLDPSNGACLCGEHHTRKTAQARRLRYHGTA
jgi:hypothetical protein